MLTLLLCTDWVAGRGAVLERIKKNVDQQITGNILIVPELISHETERRLCQTVGDHASRFAEVLSFSRLVRRVCEYCNISEPACLDNGGRVVTMAAAARSLHSKLKAYASVETKPEFLTGLLDAVDEFKRCCISAADLRFAAAKTEGSLAQKLEELSLLLESYDALCAQGKRDPRDQMNWVLQQLEDCDFAENHRFFVDGFPDLTRQNLAVLEHAVCCCQEVVVSLNCDQLNTREPAFEKASATAAELIRCAKDNGVEYEVLVLNHENTAFGNIWKRLFRGKLENGVLQQRLFTYKTDSAYDECTLVAEKIMEKVRQGSRFKDFSVVCTDTTVYTNVLASVFERCGIPCYLSGTEDILDKPIIATAISALDAALGGFEQVDVLRFVRTMLSSLSLEQCDKLENYAVIWNISGNKWLDEWKYHPEGLADKWTDRNIRDLEELNSLREKVIVPLARLRDSFRDANSVPQQVQALYDFLEQLQVAKQLSIIANKLYRDGEDRQAQIFNQLWEILIGALEQLYDALGGMQWDNDAFVRLLKLLLSQYDVGTIPPVLDAVTFGPVSAMRCQQADHLFLVGAVEGALPGYSGAAGVLNDQERTALRLLGVPLTGGALEGLQAEFAEIYGVFCGANSSVTVTCPAGQPSYIFRRLCVLSGTLQEEELVGSALFDPAEAASYLVRFGAEAVADKLGLEEFYTKAQQCRDYTLGSVDRENIDALYGSTLQLSASQIDKQANCRLHYFLRYGLRVRERKPAQVDPAEFGTYVHDVLEKTVAHIMVHGGFKSFTAQQVLDLAAEFSVAYEQEHFGQLDSERLSYLLKRNSGELKLIVEELWAEFQNCDFAPVGVEVGFGKDECMAAIDVSGKTMNAVLGGYVDRVDQWKDGGRSYFRVVDYKTGKKDFDYCDLLNGIGLQMLLYLFALEEQGGALLGENSWSAGVQYFSARAPLISVNGSVTPQQAAKERESAWKRKGLILSDEDVVRAMDHTEGFSRLSCKENKNGDITGDIADRERFKQLKQYVYALVGHFVDEIASGNIDANPYTRGAGAGACTYCPYSGVCNPECVPGRRVYKAINAEQFWNDVERSVKEHG